MGRRRHGVIALLCFFRLASGLPSALRFTWRVIIPLAETYDQVVKPIVERVIAHPAERASVNLALRSMSLKIGVSILSYAKLVGAEPYLEIAALAGAVTRLYDDLIDNTVHVDPGSQFSFDVRMGGLFSGGRFAPSSDLERLLADMVGEIRARLDSRSERAAVTAMNSLHEYQCLSRRQRDPEIPRSVLEKICRGKGGHANQLLCGLVNPDMAPVEQELAMVVGEEIQRLDDYVDLEPDTRNGITSLATLGETKLADITLRISALSEPLILLYGAERARRYYGMFCYLLLWAWLVRRLPLLARLFARFVARAEVRMFMRPGAEVAT